MQVRVAAGVNRCAVGAGLRCGTQLVERCRQGGAACRCVCCRVQRWEGVEGVDSDAVVRALLCVSVLGEESLPDVAIEVREQCFSF